MHFDTIITQRVWFFTTRDETKFKQSSSSKIFWASIIRFLSCKLKLWHTQWRIIIIINHQIELTWYIKNLKSAHHQRSTNRIKSITTYPTINNEQQKTTETVRKSWSLNYIQLKKKTTKIVTKSRTLKLIQLKKKVINHQREWDTERLTDWSA